MQSQKLKLNLGCGYKKLEGFVNVDKYGEPDLKHDLEVFPWPWENNSVDEVRMVHVLEHLGKDTESYKRIIQELYRVCDSGAKVFIVVPHHRHEHFFADPTHVRTITPLGLSLFSQRLNQEWIEAKAANSPLGIYWEVDFELKAVEFVPSQEWYKLHPEEEVKQELFGIESTLYNNLISEVRMLLEVVK